ncbi:DJ-1/PfpI family protein [Alkalihalobacillus sp. FSL W8-0930]
MKTFEVGILLFNGVDALDFVGPYEVFNMTTFHEKDLKKLLTSHLEHKPFNVSSVSLDGEKIVANHGLEISPQYSFKTAPTFDILIIPGGTLKTIQTVVNNNEILEWIKSNQQALIGSVCTGAIVLAEAELLNTKKATTNRAAFKLMERSYPEISLVKDAKYVDAGSIITSAGVSSGINMALYLVERLFDVETATRTRETIEFD